MEPHHILNLFDSFWFTLEIFKRQSFSSNSSNSQQNPDLQIEDSMQKPQFSRLPTIRTRSKSEFMSSMESLNFNSLSPDSVLLNPEDSRTDEEPKRKKKLGITKSLSDLEFEELKGFMDLGFVFSEEDSRDSSLVEIIPGLQRLGGRRKSHDEVGRERGLEGKCLVRRPYLSEAWEVLERRKREKVMRREREKPLLVMDWRVNDLHDEVDMKDKLKWWAHTVASAVR